MQFIKEESSSEIYFRIPSNSQTKAMKMIKAVGIKPVDAHEIHKKIAFC